MTELQLLIRDSNEMPPLIRADYLEDAGFDLEADWLRTDSRLPKSLKSERGSGSGFGTGFGTGFGYGYGYGFGYGFGYGSGYGSGSGNGSGIGCSGRATTEGT
jgi:hypothetical protein